MIITVFRSRLKAGVEKEYQRWATEMGKLAMNQPGYVSEKTFVAPDGERVSIAEFESEHDQRAWRTHPEHVAAQEKGRRDFYLEYRIQVCRMERQATFPRDV